MDSLQNNQISRKIDITDKKAEYDENVKWLLSEKIILAHILVYAAREYQGMNAKEVVSLIEGTPQISEAMVNPGETNTSEIIGDNVEDAIPNEGKIYYDIRFRAWAPDRKELIQLIIDVEAQKKYHPGYDIISRGIFYGARMISAQMGSEFTGDDYGKLKKVYSIWICMDSPKYAENTITEYSISPRNLVGHFPLDKGRYDLMSVVMICLSKELAQSDDTTKLHRLLGTLLSSEMTRQEKKDIIETEYGIPMTEGMERRVNIMCNLSDTIEERGIEQGIERGEAKQLIENIMSLQRKLNLSVEEACKLLDVSMEQYRAALELIKIEV